MHSMFVSAIRQTCIHKISIGLITTGVSQEIKKPLWIKAFEMNIRDVQSSAHAEKKGNHYLSLREEESEVEGGKL